MEQATIEAAATSTETVGIKVAPVSEKDLVKKMFNIQYQLNTNTYDSAWIEKGRSEEFDYLMAAVDEVHEFLRSIPFQWWTKDKPDRQNQVTELVDAWHFLMSQCIIDNMTIDPAAAVERAVTSTYNAYFYTTAYGELREQTVKRQAKALVVECYLHRQYIQEFFKLCAMANVSLQLLYARYVAKATLNKFRVENGYKKGTYLKIWQIGSDKGEDNYFLSRWVDAGLAAGHPVPTEEDVNHFLFRVYSEVQAEANNPTT